MFTRKHLFVLLFLLYAAGAIPSAWKVISHTEASTQAVERILKLQNMQNEGAQALDRFSKGDPILGALLASPVKNAFQLPSIEESDQALHSEVPHLLKSVRQEASVAAWWSCFLLSFSLLYVVTSISLERSFMTRPVLFSLTAVSLTCFVIGVLAPAMVVWTAPTIPMASGKLEFVLQHEVRGIAAIIRELFTSGHWVIAGFLFLFSILTPLTKASLTFFVTSSRFKALNFKIGHFLHSIGKWSMADVFVAGVLLALYAVKAQEATKSMPCLGLFYFIGYCLLSLTTTELLIHSGAVAGGPREKTGRRLGGRAVAGLFAVLICFVLGAGLYTYAHDAAHAKGSRAEASSFWRPDDADLILPASK